MGVSSSRAMVMVTPPFYMWRSKSFIRSPIIMAYSKSEQLFPAKLVLFVVVSLARHTIVLIGFML